MEKLDFVESKSNVVTTVFHSNNKVKIKIFVFLYVCVKVIGVNACFFRIHSTIEINDLKYSENFHRVIASLT